MKSFVKYLALAALFCTLYACGPMGDDVELALTREDPDALLYTFERQTVQLKMDCNRSWKAACSEEWIELETKKGSEGEAQNFKFILSVNPEYTYRTGEIVITAGDRQLVLTVTQEPEIHYYVKTNFEDEDLIYESELPSGWYSIDADGDGNGWRCCRDQETQETFAYSTSYDGYFGTILTPDNWMTTPRFTFPQAGCSLKWDVRGSEADYLGDKYQVWVVRFNDVGQIEPLEKIFEEVTVSATELTHHEVSLDKYAEIKISIAFRHCESSNMSRVMLTNIEVSNRH